MNKNQYIVKDVAKHKVVKATCKYEGMSVLDLRCYLRSLGYARVENSVVRNDLHKVLRKEAKAIHLFVEYPAGMFSRKHAADAEKEYQRRVRLFA
jgi:hypothetical protein